MKLKMIMWWLMALLCGTIIIFLFWPKSSELPKLKTIEPFVAENIVGQQSFFQNNKIKIVAFFYTNCPDICPFTFSDLKLFQQKITESELLSNSVEIVTITLDPEEDTIERLTKYKDSFGVDSNGWRVLRATKEQTEKIASDFQLTFKKVDGNFIAHRTTMFLVDKSNAIRATYNMASSTEKVDTERIIKDIYMLINE
jgi:protein SCO1